MFTSRKLEEDCKQPVAIGTAICTIVLMSVHAIGMYALFTKLNLMFNPSELKAVLRRQAFAKQVTKKFFY